MPEPLFRREFFAGLRPATLFKKEALAQEFSFEFCEISKNTFLTEHLWTTASNSPSIVFQHISTYYQNYY